MWTRNLLHRHCSCLLHNTQSKTPVNNNNLFESLTHGSNTSSRRLFLTSASEKVKQFKHICVKRYDEFYKNYEEFVGLTDVQNAQLDVKNAEKNFLEARGKERLIMRDMVNIRNELKHIREKLSHVNYSSPLYPQLANEQHELVTREEKIKDELDLAEEKERDSFLVLSAAMRDSYEKERARVERTKNWSLIGSVIGTILGFLGSSYINRVRTTELKQMVLDKQENAELKEGIDKVIPFVHESYSDIKDELTQLEGVLVNRLIELPQENDNTISSLPSNTNQLFNKLLQEMQELKVIARKIDADFANDKNSQAELKQEIIKLRQSVTKTFDEATQPSSLDTTTQHHESENYVEERLMFKPRTFYDIAIWGAVMSALYYVLTV